MGPGSAMSAQARSNLAAVGAGLIGAPLVVGVAASGYYAAPLLVPTLERVGVRLLSTGQTLAGLGVKYVQTKQKWANITAGITVAGLLTPGYHRNPFSHGGGGPVESPISTEGLYQQGQPVPVVVPAASNSAHGGRRSGSKPRKRCPPGSYWNGRRCVKR